MSRAFASHTKLGRLLKESGLKKLELGYASGVNERTLTEYLAGRAKMSNKHLARLAAVFEVEPEELID